MTVSDLFTDQNLAMITSIVVPAILALIGWLFKSKRDRAEAVFRTGVDIAYQAVNDVSKVTPNTVDDKIALGLGFLREWLAAHKQTLDPVNEEKAKLLFKAMHGAGK